MAVNILWYPCINNKVLFLTKRYIRLQHSLITTYFEAAIHGLTIKSNLELRQKEGLYLIIDYLDLIKPESSKWIDSLRFNHIIFLDQITSVDGFFLLEWEVLKNKLISKGKGGPTLWYQYIVYNHIFFLENNRLNELLEFCPT